MYHYFKSDVEQVKVGKAYRSEGASKREMMADRLIEVSNALGDLYLVFHCCDIEF